MGTAYDGSEEEKLALDTFIKLMRAAHWSAVMPAETRERVGLTRGQFGVLEALHHLGPMMQSTLADKLLSSSSNISVVIDNLEKRELVERRPSPEDRRRRVAHLTEKGEELIQEIFPKHVERIARVMEGLTEEEQRQLGRLCRKLGRHAEEIA